MTTEEAIAHIAQKLASDDEYREGWIANIAWAQLDAEYWYKKRTGKRYLNRQDKHAIACEGARNFIALLCAHPFPDGEESNDTKPIAAEGGE